MYMAKHKLYSWHFLFCSPLLPLSTYLEPSFCDRIRPPRSHVARKLTPLFPHLAHVPSHPKSRPPLGFPDPNMHLIRRTLRTQPISSRTGIFADMRRRAKLQTNAAESIINRLLFQECKGLLCVLCLLYVYSIFVGPYIYVLYAIQVYCRYILQWSRRLSDGISWSPPPLPALITGFSILKTQGQWQDVSHLQTGRYTVFRYICTYRCEATKMERKFYSVIVNHYNRNAKTLKSLTPVRSKRYFTSANLRRLLH